MKNILSVSMCLPYQGVPHAGGKTVNYYLGRFAQEENINVKVVCKIRNNEKNIERKKINDNFEVYTVSMPDGNLKKVMIYLTNIWSKVNPINKYGNTLIKYIYSQYLKTLKSLKKTGYKPDVIILEWTEMVLFINEIKSIFPDAYIIASEHDVKFQSECRKYLAEKNKIKKLYKKIKYMSMKKKEICALNLANLIVTQSNKDKKILENNGIEASRQIVISPYYMSAKEIWRGQGKEGIAVYGDMSRPENYESAIWFIENVFKKIENKDIKLYVIGANPVEKLNKYNSNKIIITGFVENVFEYLNNCFCMVAPLQIGAGIKVKCVEAISYGIPLIANDIAVEGIAIEDRKDYLHCTSCDEFLSSIHELYGNIELQYSLSINARNFSKKNLNMEDSYREYYHKIREVL